MKIITNAQAVHLDAGIKRARARMDDAKNKQKMLLDARPYHDPSKMLYMGEPIDANAWLRALSYQIRWHQKWLDHGVRIAKHVRTYSFADFDRDYPHYLLPR